ncbi:MAG: DUF4340 domain-containing protein [Planctomycetota bacterium]
MSLKSLLFLILLVGVLLVAVRFQGDKEAQQPKNYNGPLLGDVQPDRVVEIRWDHIEDDQYVALEKVGDDWMLVDPLRYPAARDRVQLLFDGLFTQAGEVPTPDIAKIASQFDPPRAVVTVFEEIEGGTRRKTEVRLGQLHADGMSQYFLVGGRYLRALNNLDTVLHSTISDLRDHHIFRIHPLTLVGVERHGFVPAEVGLRDLEFLARREGPNWQMYRPSKVKLDPGAMGLWAQVLCSLRLDRFAWDAEDAPLADFGLTQPEVRLVLQTSEGEALELQLANPDGQSWYAKRADQPFIWVMPNDVMQELLGEWAELRDESLLRAFRTDIGSIELRGEHRVLLTQTGNDGPWTVSDWVDAQKDWARLGRRTSTEWRICSGISSRRTWWTGRPR